jgi:DNA replication protein DnaC
MWMLLRRLLDQEQRSFAWLNAVRFRSGLQAAARDGATDSFVQRLAGVQVLYWDDLGQTHLTGAASEMLLRVVEERTAGRRPILATTQYSAEQLEFQFERPEMGQAIRRRLNEFCSVLVVRKTLLVDESNAQPLAHLPTLNLLITTEVESGRSLPEKQFVNR